MAKKSVGQKSIEPELEETAKEKGEKKKSIKRLRKNTSFKDSFSSLLSVKAPSGALSEAGRGSPFGESINYQEAILLAQILKAINGDTQAAVFVRDTSGNKIKETEVKDTKRKKFEDF